jgi:histone H1/5
MAARAQEISQEAGSKVAAAMKDVIGAAAGLAGFAIESARDLVQYMVRRGQMTQEEADKLMREAEEAYAKKKPIAPRVADAPKVVAKTAEHHAAPHHAAPHHAAPHHAAPKKAAPAAKKPVAVLKSSKSAKPAKPAKSAKSAKPAQKKVSKPASAASRSKAKPAAKKKK